MKLTFLGTSHGVPSGERFCSCTMIEAGGARYFIDCGAPLIDLLLRRGIDLTSLRAVFTTHLHGDHVNGILHFADLLNWYFTRARVQIYLTEPAGIELFTRLIEAVEGAALDRERIDFRLMTPQTIYDDGVIRLTPLPNGHLAGAGRPSYSYLLEAEGKRVIFTGDMSPHLTRGDFPTLPTDLIISEMAHFGVDEVLPFLERCQAREVAFNHVFPLDKLAQIEALNGRFGYPIRTLADGDEIVL